MRGGGGEKRRQIERKKIHQLISCSNLTRKHSSCETFRLTSNSLNVIPTFVQVVLSVSFTYSHPASVDQIGGGRRQTYRGSRGCGMRHAHGRQRHFWYILVRT